MGTVHSGYIVAAVCTVGIYIVGTVHSGYIVATVYIVGIYIVGTVHSGYKVGTAGGTPRAQLAAMILQSFSDLRPDKRALPRIKTGLPHWSSGGLSCPTCSFRPASSPQPF